MLRRIGFGLAACAAGVMAAVGGPALAEEYDMATGDADTGLWELTVTPYAWFTGVSGDIKAGGRKFDINASFIDIVQESDWIIPLMGHAQAKKDRFSIFTDGFYTQMQFTKKQLVTLTPLQGPIADPIVKFKNKLTLTQTLAFAEFDVGYEVAEWDQGPLGMSTLEILAGARYWYGDVDARLKVDRTVKLPNLGLKQKKNTAYIKSGSQDWVDPVVGIRVNQTFSEGRQLQFLGDIGGFGVGSEFTWQVFAGYNHFTPIGNGNTLFATTIGYRAIGFDYDVGSGSNAQSYDLVLHGPIAGLSLRW